jgi:ribonuclease P protein component
MLKKVNRLAKAKDIAAAFSRGRTFFNPFFTIKFFSRAPQKLFTVVVSTKVFKSAVKRNRLKRILREYVRKNLAQFKSGSYMVIAKPKVSRLPEKDILPAFLDVISRLR